MVEGRPMLRFSLVLILLLVGCGPAKIDGASEESMKESVAKIREGLDAADEKRFHDALGIVVMESTLPGGNLLSAAAMNPGEAVAKLGAKLDGKTADDVIAMADAILAERKAREIEQAKKEIAELEQKKADAFKARESLKAFEVTRSRFYKREQQYLGEEPIIELDVKNGTGIAVSRAYFKATLATPGRSVAWLSEEFNYSIRGGLEPGEGASWSLDPGYGGPWRSIDIPADAVFTVEVVRVDGPDGKAAFSSEGFTENDQERLEKLLASVAGSE